MAISTVHEIYNKTANIAEWHPQARFGELPPAEEAYRFADIRKGDTVQIVRVMVDLYESTTHLDAGAGPGHKVTRRREIGREVLAEATLGYSRKRGWFWK